MADPGLLQPILALQGDRLVVNLHPTIPLLIRESKCMAKMNIEIPIVALTLLFKQNHFDTISDSLNVRKWNSQSLFNFQLPEMRRKDELQLKRNVKKIPLLPCSI